MKLNEIIEIICLVLVFITALSYVIFEFGAYGKIFAGLGVILFIIEILKGEDNGE